jgi:hypothetical protein
MAAIIIKKLGDFFNDGLADATQVWVAAALFNDDGFAELQGALNENVTQHYLIGIDLPTPVSVLRTMQARLCSGKFEAKISKTDKVSFHPKVYIFQYRDGTFKAVVGSANLTSGGLTNNTELNILIDDPLTCVNIKTWFEGLYTDAYPLDDENIKRYEQKWLAYQPISSALRAMQSVVLQKPVITSGGFDDFDFSDHYFLKEHYMAFRPERWYDYSKQADADRKEVSEIFTELHGEIYDQFSDYGLTGLYPNVPQHLVSMYRHDPSRSKQALNAMWLSYGKSEDEIKRYHKEFRQPFIKGEDQEDDKQSFINHARLQIRIEFQEIGIWILFAKNNGGGKIDRNIFKERMRKEPAYRTKFYLLLKELPEPYWINVAGERKDISWLSDEDTLYDFCKKDTDNFYFIIGRDYAITDPEMSTGRLPGETLKVFSLLYPLYQHMRHYF